MSVNHPVSRAHLTQLVLSKDVHFLTTLSKKISTNPKNIESLIRQFDQAFERSVASRQSRAARAGGIKLNPDLPVSAYGDKLIQLIRDHQVVIVAGETGSGKTTQLPKIALMAGRGQAGQIGHTQPRRLAARRVAMRISEELGEPLGGRVGFKIRFTDQGSADSLIKLMTDGILLNEMGSDRFLARYDTLIIDEAHERSLNIDFILGLLKKLLKRRADLKLIITSATLDIERFSDFFSEFSCSVSEVPGRSYPVEVIYHNDTQDDEQPASQIDQEDLDTADHTLISAIDQCFLLAKQRGFTRDADILVFASTAREIDELAQAIEEHGFKHTEVLKLHARLPEAQQALVFDTSSRRAPIRIILSTNVAETAVTVPGIRFVIDLGYHRISRYSHRSGVQRLPIERISQAAANQRAGRAGRLSAGVCIRLYSSEDFAGMSEFGEPEIQRTNLASVLLTMQSLRLGDPSEFDFIDRPDARLITDARKLLFELGAVGAEHAQTQKAGSHKPLNAIGKKIARMPVDPRLARALCAPVDDDTRYALCVICAALSIPDVRERPADKKPQADQKHALFSDKESDFMFYLNLWRDSGLANGLSHRKRASFAKGHFLSSRRMLEWERLTQQLTELCSIGQSTAKEFDHELIHRSLLSGLLSRVAKKTQERREYLAAKNIKAMVFPGSALRNKPYEWVMAYELAETSQVFLRCCAKVDPEWILSAGSHLLQYTYMEPHYSKRRGRVMASAQISLFGLVVEQNRRVDYSAIDVELSHQLFVQQALVENQIGIRAPFSDHNEQLIAEIKRLEDQTRQSLLVDESQIQQFFLERVPEQIATRKAFESWRAAAEKEQPDLLFLSRSFLTGETEFDDQDFPNETDYLGSKLKLIYEYAPGETHDGVRVQLPRHLLQQFDPAINWAVPGWYEEQILALLKGLDKPKRIQLQPLNQTAVRIADQLKQVSPKNLNAIAGLISKSGVTVLATELNVESMPLYTQPMFEVLDDQGRVLERSRDFESLKLRHQVAKAQIKATIIDFPADFNFEEVLELNGAQFNSYRALTPVGEGLELKSFVSAELAMSWQREGILWLMSQRFKSTQKSLYRYLDTKILLRFSAFGSSEDLRALFYRGVLVQALDQHVDLMQMPVNLSEFKRLMQKLEPLLVPTASKFAPFLVEVLTEYQRCRSLCLSLDHVRYVPIIDDVLFQLDGFEISRFTFKVRWQQMEQIPRYLSATRERLERLPASTLQDLDRTEQINQHQEKLKRLKSALGSDQWPIDPPEVVKLDSMLQELRISLFAQPMKTLFTVSDKRVEKLWQQLKQKLGLT